MGNFFDDFFGDGKTQEQKDIEKAHSEGVKAGENAGLIDATFHGFEDMARTVVPLPYSDTEKAREAGYHEGLMNPRTSRESSRDYSGSYGGGSDSSSSSTSGKSNARSSFLGGVLASVLVLAGLSGLVGHVMHLSAEQSKKRRASEEFIEYFVSQRNSHYIDYSPSYKARDSNGRRFSYIGFYVDDFTLPKGREVTDNFTLMEKPEQIFEDEFPTGVRFIVPRGVYLVRESGSPHFSRMWTSGRYSDVKDTVIRALERPAAELEPGK